MLTTFSASQFLAFIITVSSGVGKTNILDAIHYLSQTKSYFNHIDAQNIQFDENYFMLKGVFNKDESDAEIQCNIIEGEGKSIKNNQKKYKRFSEHIGQFPIVIISPTDTNLILEGSEVRRKYLDSSIAQYKQSYLQLPYHQLLLQIHNIRNYQEHLLYLKIVVFQINKKL